MSVDRIVQLDRVNLIKMGNNHKDEKPDMKISQVDQEMIEEVIKLRVEELLTLVEFRMKREILITKCTIGSIQTQKMTTEKIPLLILKSSKRTLKVLGINLKL